MFGLKCWSYDFDQACNAEQYFKTLQIQIRRLLVRLSDQVCTDYILNGGTCHHLESIKRQLDGT